MSINLKMLSKALRETPLPDPEEHDVWMLGVHKRVDDLNMMNMPEIQHIADVGEMSKTYSIDQVKFVSVRYADGSRTWKEWEIVL